MLSIFFDIKGTVHKEFVLAGQTVNSENFCVISRPLRENVRKLRPELWPNKNFASRQRTVSHFLFHQGILDKSNMTVVPHPHYFPLFPRLKITLKDRHFDTIEVIKAESHALLKTLTEYDFQDVFKKWQKR
jgi:hypothetical protein